MDDDIQDRLSTILSGGLRVLAALAIALVVVPPVAGLVAVTTLLSAPLPVGDLPDEKPAIVAEPSVVVDATGRQIALFRGFDQTVDVTPDQIPDVLKDAFVAIEDRRFWHHNGVDYEGIARAARTNVEVGGVAQGGSTITQQYVKNVYLSDERSLERKVTEALLATEIEKRMTKEEILFGYLTSSYFGSGAYGIGAAAEVYFDKPVSGLDLSEAATLAGLVKAPTRLSPYEDRSAADERRRLVLQAMLDEQMITEEEYERAARRRLWSVDDVTLPGGPVTTLVPRQKKGALDHPFFVDYVESDLLEQLGPDLVYRGGLKIETTIVPELQTAAEESVAERLENTEYPVEMAMASIDPSTGHVVAMVGGRDYDFSQVNLATGGSTGFQPGSSFKPIVLAGAFSMGLSPESSYPAPGRWQVPGCGGGDCAISNYDHRGYGDISLRAATHASVNTVFAQLVVDVTIDDTIDLARRLGLERIEEDREYGASLALGSAESSPLEMASAYGTFANRGQRVPPTGIRRVIDADGNVLIDNRARPGDQVLDRVVADNVTDVLTGVIDNGTGKRAAIGRPAAGKTGTAQDYRAAWFVGYTPDLATAVWMGHADRLESLRGVNGVGAVTGGSHPAAAWSSFMAAAHEGREVRQFPVPAEIVPIADTAAEVIAFRVRAETVIGESRQPRSLPANCGGSACGWRSVARPAIPTPTLPPPPPTAAPRPQNSAPPGSPGPSPEVPTTLSKLPAPQIPTAPQPPPSPSTSPPTKPSTSQPAPSAGESTS